MDASLPPKPVCYSGCQLDPGRPAADHHNLAAYSSFQGLHAALHLDRAGLCVSSRRGTNKAAHTQKTSCCNAAMSASPAWADLQCVLDGVEHIAVLLDTGHSHGTGFRAQREHQPVIFKCRAVVEQDLAACIVSRLGTVSP